MPNRLADNISPYLLQHADNLVDWWPWGEAAFAEARRRDVPVLLSVGYAACHWCHVMAHESFEAGPVAEAINEASVAIKVDREERPDLDAVYMRATQIISGSGGWPMTVFLDHQRRPFHAGTYFPPSDRAGMPGLPRVLSAVTQAWRHDRAKIERIADQVGQELRRPDALAGEREAPRSDLAPKGVQAATDGTVRQLTGRSLQELQEQFDPQHGGFGGAPKFPPSLVIEFLLRHHAGTETQGSSPALVMAERTAQAMARGGMYDQLGGGFARYSVDATWTVPHFEKMIYDNALLMRTYLHLWRATGDDLARRIVEETGDFVLREMRTPQGGFASSLDADSAPVMAGQNPEGAFYVWTPEQVSQALNDPAEAAWARELLGVTPEGTFESGTSVLSLTRDPDDVAHWARVRAALLAARSVRPRPARDDKIVAGWNGWMIAALAEAGLLLGRSDFTEAAQRAADLVMSVHGSADSLLRTSRDGVVGAFPGVLEDYAAMAEGLLALYQCTGDLDHLDSAAGLLDVALERFASDGTFFETDAAAEALLTRPRDPSDNVTPSGWTAITGALLTFTALTGSERHRDAVDSSVAALARHPMADHPRFLGWGLAVMEAWLSGPQQTAVVGPPGPERDALLQAAASGTGPGAVVAAGLPGQEEPALLRERGLLQDRPTAYVCQHFACRLPTTDPAEVCRLVGARQA